MAIYDIDGNELFHVYDIDGNELDKAYDIDGNLVYSAEPIELTVMSFNVGCFYTQYFPCPNDKTTAFYNRHHTIFGNADVDICGMQEWYDSIGTVDADVLMDEFFSHYIANYEAYGGSSKPHNAITYAANFPMTNASITAYVNQSGEIRYYQKCYVNVGGKSICLLNTHLGTSNIRNSQFLELLDVMENEEYFIAFGDFNFRIESVGDSEYNLSVKLALDRGFHSAQNASGIFITGYSGETVATSERKTALDNIITSGNIDISNVHIDTTKFTDGLCEENEIMIDHVPIIATVTIN